MTSVDYDEEADRTQNEDPDWRRLMVGTAIAGVLLFTGPGLIIVLHWSKIMKLFF